MQSKINKNNQDLPIVGKKYCINPGLLANNSGRAWWENLKTDERTMMVSSVKQNENQVLFSGTIQADWFISEWPNPFGAIQIEMILSGIDTQPMLSLEKLTGTTLMGGEQVVFNFKATPDGTIQLVTDQMVLSESLDFKGLNNQLLVDKVNVLSKMLQLIGNDQNISYSTNLISTHGLVNFHNWMLKLEDITIGDMTIPISNIQAKLNVSVADQSISSGTSVDLEALLGDRIRVLGSINGQQDLHLVLATADNRGLPGPVDALTFLGLETVSNALDSAIKQVPIIDALKVERINVQSNLKTKKLSSISVHGTTKIENYVVNFSVNWPAMQLRISLSSLTPIQAGLLLKQMFPEWEGAPVNMKISALEIQLGIKPFALGTRVVLTDLWSFKIGDFPIDLKEIMVSARYADSQFTGTVAGKIDLDGIDFLVMGSNQNIKEGWYFKTQVGAQNPIHLHDFLVSMRRFFGIPEVGDLPKIQLDHISLEFKTKATDFVFEASASLEESIGPVSEAESRIRIQYKEDESTKKKVFEIKWTGNFIIAEQKFSFDIDLGNPEWHLEATWKSDKGLNLIELLHKIAPEVDTTSVSKPVENALTLTEISISYYNEVQAFNLLAKTKGGEALQFMLLKSKSKEWGAFFAIGYENPESLPEFGKELEKHKAAITLNDCWLLFSWMPDDVSGLSVGGATLKTPVKLSQMGKGLGLAAKFSLQNQNSNGAKHLGDISSEGEFSVLAQLKLGDDPGLSVDFQWTGELLIPTGGHSPLQLNKCGIKMELTKSNLLFEAYGSVDFSIDHYPVTASLAIDLSLNAISLRGGVATKDEGIPLFGLKDVKFLKLCLLLGIQFEPPGVLLGLQGEMTFRAHQTTPDKLGVVLVFPGPEPIPIPLYFAVDISHMELLDLLKATDSGGWAGKQYIGEHLVGFDNLSFYWVRPGDKLLLPDGSKVSPGVGFHAVFYIWTWTSFLMFEFSESLGFVAKGEFSPIKNDLFQLIGRGSGRTALAVKEGDVWVPVSNAIPPKKGAETKPIQLIRPGGAFLDFNSTHSPYLNASFEIRVLDAFQWKTDILVSDTGIITRLTANIPNIYSLDLNLNLTPPKVMEAYGTLFGGLYFDLPVFLRIFNDFKKRAYIGVHGNLSLAAGTEKAFYFHFSYEVKVLGLTFPGLSITIPHAPKDFGDFIKMVIDNILTNIIRLVCQNLLKSACPIKHLNALEIEHVMNGGELPMSAYETLSWVNLLVEKMDYDKALPSEFSKLILSETDEEIQYLKAKIPLLKQHHKKRVKQGLKSLDIEMNVMQREIDDLTDSEDKLYNLCHDIWQIYGGEYSLLFNQIADLEHEVAKTGKGIRKLKALQRDLEKVRAEILKATMQYAVEPSPTKGYPEVNGKFAMVAVTHHANLVATFMENEVQLHRINRMAELSKIVKPTDFEDRQNHQWVANLTKQSKCEI